MVVLSFVRKTFSVAGTHMTKEYTSVFLKGKEAFSPTAAKQAVWCLVPLNLVVASSLQEKNLEHRLALLIMSTTVTTTTITIHLTTGCLSTVTTTTMTTLQ